MKKILFILLIVSAFVACDKDDYIIRKEQPYVLINWGEDCKYVNDSLERKFPYLDAQNGDKLTFKTSDDSYFPAVWVYDKDDNKIAYSFKRTDTGCDFEIGTIQKVGECTYELQILPIDNADKFKCIAFVAYPFDNKIKSSPIHLVFLDKNALIQ